MDRLAYLYSNPEFYPLPKVDNTDELNLTNFSGGNDWDPAWVKPSSSCVGGITPVDVMLVIDRSGSMYGVPLEDEKIAAKAFVDRMNMVQDQVGLVSFAGSATLDRQLTHDSALVKSAIDALIANGNTNMTDGIKVSQNELQSNRHNPLARPVMIFMSDGQPTVDSPSSAIAAAQVAKNAGTRIFTIGLGGVDDNLMRQIASLPSDYYHAPSPSDLTAIYQTIAGQMVCAQPAVKVNPVNNRVPVNASNFSINILAKDVTNLAAYQVEFVFDPSIIQVNNITTGPFIGSTGRTVSPVAPMIDNNTGIARFGAFTYGTQPGVNGTGVLATITLSPRTKGRSILHLQNLQLADPSGSPLFAITEDGQIDIMSCFGDFDGDGDVDILDLQRAASHWNCYLSDACYDVQFDTEPDGDIDVFDLQRFAMHWGTTCSTMSLALVQGGLIEQPVTQTTINLQIIPTKVLISPDSSVTLAVQIKNADNLGAFQTDIVYDPTIIEVQSVTIGPFLSSTGRTVSLLGPVIDNSNGRVTFGAYTLGSQPGATGSGDLAYIHLRGKSVGYTLLEFQHTGISDPQGNPFYLGQLESGTVVVSQQVYKAWLPVLIK